MGPKRLLRALFVTSFIAVGAVQACDDDPHASITAGPENVSQIVGAKGGTVGTADGNAAVVIPPGALPGDVTITIRSNPTAPPPASVQTVGAAYTFGPDGLTFLVPITVTLAFDPARLPAGGAATQIVVFTAPDGSNAYAPLPTSVKDPTHVSATTTHFSTDVPGVPASTTTDAGMDAATEAATEAGMDAAACYVSCLSKGSSSQDGSVMMSCDCNATCDGHTYKMSCSGSSCSCLRDGAQTGVTPGSCGTSMQNLGIYNTGCGFPGEMAPPPDCTIPACGGMSSSDGGMTSCMCSTTCKGHAYAMSCTNDNCNCTTDGVSTINDASAGACTSAFTTYNDFCNYKSTYDASPSSPGEAGSPPMSSDGGAD